MGGFSLTAGRSDSAIVDQQLQADAQRIAAQMDEALEPKLVLQQPYGADIELPERLASLLLNVVESLAEKGAVRVQVLPDELTTSLASAILGVSRPTLMKRIEAGEIPAHKVGSHTRINRDDLMRYRRSQEARRQAAIEGFLDIDDDL